MIMNMKASNQHQHFHHHKISSFNPSCCLKPPPHHHRRAKDDTPSSPRVGCMGQMRRSKSCNNRSSNKKLLQFKRMFSSSSSDKNSSPRVGSIQIGDRCSLHRQDIDIVSNTMDPPLPVTKHRVGDRDALGLWRRRRGGDALQGLEIARVRMQHAQQLRRSLSMADNFEGQEMRRAQLVE
ncbi:uncharacterized protein A4U43_C06F16180 [Asparagus officinalis]|uniref:Uncharacterized protein n=1 Tax=Asparagus officinalis TaxID=4686 RepID=A0A5P1EMV5_ASPOF|nr:uncharacterized protein A4U43_C06F16180 [Asparagus officinalis]